MNKLKSIAWLLLGLLFANCSEYYRIQQSNDYNLMYNKALEYYEYGDYFRAKTLLDNVVNVMKGSDKGERALFLYADCYYHLGDYVFGSHYFENFYTTYPLNDSVEMAYYMAAYCYYKDSPRPDLDQATTVKAINAFQTYINKFPSGSKVDDCNNLISELRHKLEEKSYMTAKLYYKIGDYQAATITLRNSLKEYPDTKYREELMYMMVKSSYLLAENSVESKKAERFQNTVTEYYAFIDEYPQSQYIKEVEDMYQKTVNQIKKL